LPFAQRIPIEQRMKIVLPTYRLGTSAWLSMLCGGLALVTLIELLQTEIPLAPVMRPVSAPSVSAVPVATLPPLESFAEVIARPLFLPSRRPLPPVSAEPAKPIARFTLAGVVLEADRRVALIQSGTSPPPIMVTVGGVIDGWTVLAIESDHVVLRSAETTAELSLRDNAPPYRAPAPMVVRPSVTQR
jgi:hypothetical protein